MTKHVCQICGHEYDTDKGEKVQNIPPGTAFSILPSEWICPVCGAEKRLFREG